ncbi:hypothetical protein ACJX0J_025334, partial [Zea mays]
MFSSLNSKNLDRQNLNLQMASWQAVLETNAHTLIDVLPKMLHFIHFSILPELEVIQTCCFITLAYPNLLGTKSFGESHAFVIRTVCTTCQLNRSA